MSVKKTNIYTFVFLILVIGFSYGLLSCGKLNEAALITDSSDTSDTSTTTPTVSSSQLTSFVGPDSVDLSWTDSVGTDRTEYMVRRSSTVIPRTIFQGDTIYSGYSKSFSDTTMSTSTSYHYSIFKRASGANWSYLVSQDYRVPSYSESLASFVVSLNAYVDARNGSDFYVVFTGENGVLSVTGATSGTLDDTFVNVIDGILQKSVYYGPTDNNYVSDIDRSTHETFLNRLKNNSKKVMVVDYVTSPGTISNSYTSANAQNYISMQRPDTLATNQLPDYSHQSPNQSTVISSLSGVSNFFFDEGFLNTGLIDRLNLSTYDLVIVNPFIGSSSLNNLLNTDQVSNLKRKGGTNASSRLVFAYVDITQISNSDYRYNASSEYYDDAVSSGSSIHKVKFWKQGWRDLMYGTDTSLMYQLEARGFDGVVINAQQHY